MATRLLFLLTFLMAGSYAEDSSQCLLPMEPGPCKGHKTRFYFNPTTNKCEAFVYGGCKGNGNNFRNLRECHSLCKGHLPDPAAKAKKVHVKTAHCLLEPTANSQISCKGFFPRFTFNSKTLKCERYIYGGCGATANLYNSLEQCMTTCYHGNPLPSPSPSGLSPRMGFRARGRQPPVGEIEDDAVVIEADDICQLPPVKPHTRACLAFIKKWTFDARQGKCIEYIYGGCHGTANLFDSEADCQNTCGSILEEEELLPSPMWIQPPLCQDPPMRGRKQCMAFIPKFTFNAGQGRCEPYVYGGCGGSENLFDNEAECLKTCDIDYNDDTPKMVDVCGLSIDSGPCRAAKPMFAFNKETKRCEKFFYGGCKGNENRFATVEDCVNTCGGNEPETRSLCAAATCDRGEAMFFQAKGCLPILKRGDCCPSSWDCTRWSERLKRKDQCFWADSHHPNGKFYNVGDEVPEANGNCNVACTCVDDANGHASIMCASVDCAFEPIVPGSNCQNVYETPDHCCPTLRCNEALEDRVECRVDNQTVIKAGQKVYDPQGNNPCQECICQGDGTLHCHDVQCGLGRSQKLMDGCAPIFREGVCCPVDWICPLPIIASPPAPPSLSESVVCPPGVDPRSDYQDYLEPGDEEDLGKIAATTSANRGDARVTLPAVIDKKIGDPCLGSRPPEGACQPYLKKWTFDQGAKVCRAYKTSTEATHGSYNSFDSQSECESLCQAHIPSLRNCKAKSSSADPPMRADRCMPVGRKYRFNEASGRCEDFSHHGCKANIDSYATMEECEANCVSVERVDQLHPIRGKSPLCQQPAKTGGCKSVLKRFYYDSRSGICRAFIYSGCQGNQNNFLSPDECAQTCVPDNPNTNPLRPSPGRREPPLLYLGDPCKMPKEIGMCRARRPMFYFDATSRQCKLFFYGGCGGNANKFESVEKCKQTCRVDDDAQKALDSGEVCGQKAKCKAKWVFRDDSCQRLDDNDDDCVEDSGNHFENRDLCQNYCVTKAVASTAASASSPRSLDVSVATSSVEAAAAAAEDDPCLMDKVIGRCRAAVRRYYFDKATGSCLGFFYGGCGGNGNNFASAKECKRVCQTHLRSKPSLSTNSYIALDPLENESICAKPRDTGPCKAATPRYFFNGQKGKCERFMYGGCKGNENNFKSHVQCVKTCKKPAAEKAALGEDVCLFNDKAFNTGDVLRLADDKCTICTCSTPPDLTCRNECA